MGIDPHSVHARILVADAHADSLMWNRDLTVASSEGHVDFPRLATAGVKLQCFTVVTRGLPFIGGFPVFAAFRRWPSSARRGEWARALFQIDRLAEYCERSEGRVRLAVSSAEISQNLSRGSISAVLGIEGAQVVENQPARVRELYRRGVRFMSLTHLSNNSLGGSSTPLMGNRGLSPLGREVLDAMVELGMPVDVAHASPRLLADILAHPKVRPFCSHTGIAAVHRSWRNLDDPTLRAIADRGGVVGIIFGTGFLGGRGLDAVARHIEHAVSRMGEEGVALGSDFDGMVPLPRGMRDVRDLPQLTQLLLDRGHSVDRVEKILGGNLFRFFQDALA